ncbi:hypothetical protein V502_07632 [Pseudogymnoascus sp. VKM F-4520 (FW-2644)]|nr:hypothetical protein V502_07632 [Pseudogymnoascus sp. VKM F-4520 (FW-2644)]
MFNGDRNETPPAVELARMQQQVEVRGPEDDWTGLTDATERRKLQNRLNQRIYRRRRGVKSNCLKPEPGGRTDTMISPQTSRLSGKFRGLIAAVEHVTDLQYEDDSPQSPGSTQSASLGGVTRKTLVERCAPHIGQDQLEVIIAKFEEMARRDYMLGSPRVDQLLTLIQFNVFRALLNNTRTMGWTLEWLDSSDHISPWNSLPKNIEPMCPQALRPTHLQRTIEHHPWIDLWPIPKMRDNILLAGDSYDEDRLCNDLVEFEDIPNEQTGLIVWGEPWDSAGWEVSETFVRNWGWTVKGCVELLESTNYWRTTRSEKPLVFEV